MHKSLSRYVARNASTSLLNSGVSALAIVLCLPPLVSLLGIERYAVWAAVGVFVAIGGFLDLGVSRAIVTMLAGASLDDAQRAFSTGLAIATLIGAAAGIGLVLAWASGLNFWGERSFLTAGNNSALLLCGVVMLPMMTLTSALRAVLEAAFRLDLVNLGFALQTALNFGLALGVALLTHSVSAILWTSVLVYAVILLAHAIAVAQLPVARLRRPVPSTVRRFLRLAGESCLIVAPGAATLPLLHYLYLRQATQGADYGQFDLAMRVTVLAASTLGALAMPVLAVAAAAGRERFHELRGFVLRYTLAMLLVFVLGLAAFVVLGFPILEYAFPGHGATIHRAALIALLGAGLLPVVEPLTRSLLGLGHTRLLALSRTAMLVTAAVICLLVIDTVNLERFPLAYAAGCTVAAIVTIGAYLLLLRRLDGAPAAATAPG